VPHAKGLIAEPLPGWLRELGQRIQNELQLWVDSVPNHVLVNEYRPGEGILVCFAALSVAEFCSRTKMGRYTDLASLS